MEKSACLAIISSYNDNKPAYDLAVEQLKNELLESGEERQIYDLPNGTRIILERHKATDAIVVNQQHVKELYPLETCSEEEKSTWYKVSHKKEFAALRTLEDDEFID